jgi:hypothetical protein
MAYAVGVAEPMPRIDSTADCANCPGTVVWDEVHGWVHSTGWYACRCPTTGAPREVMAEPRKERRR